MPLLHGAGPKRNPILWFPSIYAHTLWRRTIKFDMVIHMGNGLFLDGQPHSNQRGRVPALPNFWGSVIFLHTPFVAELLFWHVEDRGPCILGSATPLITSEWSSRALSFGVLIYLCLQPLMQNDQIWHVTHMRRGMFSGGQPRHSICNKTLSWCWQQARRV